MTRFFLHGICVVAWRRLGRHTLPWLAAPSLLVAAAIGPCAHAQSDRAPATYGDAMRWYEQRAEAGDSKAQLLLGIRLREGAAELPRDLGRAIYWLERAADKEPLAAFTLGVMAEQGEGMPADRQKAISLYRTAAEAGLPEAQYNLAVLLDSGDPGDPEGARRWYEAAARQGVREALGNLGLLLAEGDPAVYDPVESLKWFLVAQRMGVEGAGDGVAALRDFLSDAEIADAGARADAWIAEYGAAFDEPRDASGKPAASP